MVWERVSGGDRRLTPAGVVEYPLAIAGERAIVGRELAAGMVLVTYQDGLLERMVPLPARCTSAQLSERWLVCTSGGSVALAYSLDTDHITTQAIASVPAFTTLAVLPPR